MDCTRGSNDERGISAGMPNTLPGSSVVVPEEEQPAPASCLPREGCSHGGLKITQAPETLRALDGALAAEFHDGEILA